MKYALFLLSSSAFAQTLTPATPAFDFNGYGFFMLVAVAVVGIILYVKHHPDTVSKLVGIVEKQADTHAAVVATLPAAIAATPTPAVDINAQIAAAVAEALRNQPKPAAVPAPTPVPAPAAQPVFHLEPPVVTGPMQAPGHPPASLDQTGCGAGDDKRMWEQVIGWPNNGYYVDRDPNQAAKDAAARAALQTANPYEGAGLLAVMTETGNSQAMRDKATQALWEATAPNTADDHSNASRCIALNANADPTFTAAVSQVISGIDPQTAMANVAADGPKFSLAQLQTALAVANTLR